MKKLLQRWLEVPPPVEKDTVEKYLESWEKAVYSKITYSKNNLLSPTGNKLADIINSNMYKYVIAVQRDNISAIRQKTQEYINSEEFLDKIVKRLKDKQLS